MRKIRDVLRLHAGGLSARQIASSVNIGRTSYARKLVTVDSGGVFGKLDPVLELYSFDEFGELV